MYLYTDETRDEALEYLAQDMINKIGGSNPSIVIIDGREDEDEYDEDDEPSADIQNLSMEMIHDIVYNILLKSYGVNIPLMANYLLVQETFHKKYFSHILKYLELCGVESYYTIIRPSTFIPFILAHKMNEKDFQPISRWDPLTRWDNFAYNPSKLGTNLSNPINAFDSIVLTINNLNNDKFIRSIYKYNSNVYEDIKQARMNGKPIQSHIRLLPACDYSGISSFINSIHEFF